jgi:sugar diacid utilization regulator
VDNFIRDVLDGNITDPDAIHGKLRTLNWVVKDSIYIFTADTTEYDDTNITQEFLCNRLEEVIAGSYAFLYNRYIVMIIARGRSNPVTDNELDSLEAFIVQKNIYIGMSRCFHNFDSLKKHFEQSIAALKTGRRFDRKKTLFHFQDFMLYYVADLVKDKFLLKDICNPSLMELLEYDRANNTQYAYTLLQYLKNERNIAHTASALHTHRNTLLYRIEKIRKIIGCDLNDSEVRLQLLLSFKLLEVPIENLGVNLQVSL